MSFNGLLYPVVQSGVFRVLGIKQGQQDVVSCLDVVDLPVD